VRWKSPVSNVSKIYQTSQGLRYRKVAAGYGFSGLGEDVKRTSPVSKLHHNSYMAGIIAAWLLISVNYCLCNV
jgi:hypothetical protein